MQKAEPLTTETLGVPGIEVVAAVPANGKAYSAPFWPDEIELLREMVRRIQDRRSYVVAPHGEEQVRIYRLRIKKA